MIYFAHGDEHHAAEAAANSWPLALSVLAIGIFSAAAMVVYMRRKHATGTGPADTPKE